MVGWFNVHLKRNFLKTKSNVVTTGFTFIMHGRGYMVLQAWVITFKWDTPPPDTPTSFFLLGMAVVTKRK